MVEDGKHCWNIWEIVWFGLRDQFFNICNKGLTLFLKERTPKSIQDMANLSDHHLHTSRYSYIVPLHNLLSKSRAWRCSWCKIVIVCQPIRRIFSIRVQRTHNYHLPFQRGTCFAYAMRDRLLLVPYDASDTNQIKARLLVDTFVKELFRGTTSHNTLWLVKMADHWHEARLTNASTLVSVNHT